MNYLKNNQKQGLNKRERKRERERESGGMGANMKNQGAEFNT
jgi:hypothetical protein